MYVNVGKRRINLRDNDFVAAGGEGRVWIINETAYKVYDDPGRMIPTAKIKDLSLITDKHVIRPLDTIRRGKDPIGYTMTAVNNAVPLQRTLTKAYRERTGLTIDRILKRIAQMRETIAHVHSHGILIVDMNELNELIDESTDSVFFIDVDSWQTPRFPATAIMDSVRDRQMNHPQDFNEGTDWFSFGILAHQMMRGIHPYRGRLDGFDHKDIDARMKANASVYQDGCRLNRAVYPESIVPPIYLEWFKATFQQGKRVPPPADFTASSEPIQREGMVRIKTNQGFCFGTILIGQGRVRSYTSLPGKKSYAITDRGCIDVNNVSNKSKLSGSIFLDECARPCIYDGKKIVDIESGYVISDDYPHEQYMSHNGNLYVKQGESIVLVSITRTRRITVQKVANVMDKATKLYEGCAVSQTRERWIINTFPSIGGSYQHNPRELIGHNVLDAKYDNDVLVIYVSNVRSGQISRIVYKEEDGEILLSRRAYDPDTANCNFITLDNGVCILAEDDYIEIFSSSRTLSTVQRITHDVLNAGVRLVKHEGMAAFIVDDEITSFRRA